MRGRSVRFLRVLRLVAIRARVNGITSITVLLRGGVFVDPRFDVGVEDDRKRKLASRGRQRERDGKTTELHGGICLIARLVPAFGKLGV